MKIDKNMTPLSALQFATKAALVGLAASQPYGCAGRVLLQSGTPAGGVGGTPSLTHGPTPPAAVLAPPTVTPPALPPPAVFSPPPPVATPPAMTPPANTPPAMTPQATTPPAGTPPTTTPPANPSPAGANPPGVANPAPPPGGAVPGSVTPTGVYPNGPLCEFGTAHGLVEEWALSCYLGCLFTTAQPANQQTCLNQLSVQPGPSPQAGLVWCPFTPETQTRVYVSAEDCSNDCHSAAQSGIQGSTFGFDSSDLSVCQAYDDLAGPHSGARPTGISGIVTMDGSPSVCLDTMAGSAAAGTTVNVFHCDGQASQDWLLVGNGPLTSNGKCLDIVNGQLSSGAFLEIAECNGSATQNWDVSGLTKQIMSRASNELLCVDTLGGLNYDYISAVLTTCDTNSETQKWNI